jgi:hypothetical protein
VQAVPTWRQASALEMARHFASAVSCILQEFFTVSCLAGMIFVKILVGDRQILLKGISEFLFVRFKIIARFMLKISRADNAELCVS